jgi:hypothetical protein
MNITQKRFRFIFCKRFFYLLLLLSSQIFLPQNTVIAQAKPDVSSTGLRISTFDIDVTPPLGSALAYNPEINKWDLGLRAKGVVLLGSGKPIVMCAIDWILISNEGMDAFKNALAVAAGTTPHRVTVHVLHQHDAPMYDAGAEQILLEAGIDPNLNKPMGYKGDFARETIRNLAVAVKNSLSHTQPVTHLGLGKATVYKVASNRNIYGKDGKVRATRYTTTKDAALRAEPEGVIDSVLSLVSFWNNDKPVAIISYYATHPQSYYGTGVANPDFPGIARFYRQLAVPDALHIHFNGAGGNIGAGKYNDGSHENRLILATRLADAMKRAWDATQRQPITASDVEWIVEPVSLPPAQYLYQMQKELSVNDSLLLKNNDVSRKMAWLKRCEAGKKLDITCLKIKNARILYMPGELFVEYQLAAKAERPDLFVAMAAYGDLGTGYVGTTEAYKKGGYEVSELASNVAPEVEGVLMKAIRNILHK